MKKMRKKQIKTVKNTPPCKQKSVLPEWMEQENVALHLRYNYPTTEILWSASASGMRTTIGVARKMKRMGLNRGVPDIMIFKPKYDEKNNVIYFGLFIEMKTEIGILSEEQKHWIDKLNKEGYLAVVCRSSNEAINVIDNYMKLSDVNIQKGKVK